MASSGAMIARFGRHVAANLGVDDALDGTSCSAVTGSKWEKSKRSRCGSTSEPFCATCAPSTWRSAACNRCVAE
jgi:hypothetical protein